jgi:hypothetical protein
MSGPAETIVDAQPAKPAAYKPTRWLLVIAALGAILIAGYFLERKHHTTEIAATEYGAEWPWPGSGKAILHCHDVVNPGGRRQPAVLVTLNGTVYALSAPSLEAAGWPDSRVRMERDASGAIKEGALPSIVARAMTLCDG